MFKRITVPVLLALLLAVSTGSALAQGGESTGTRLVCVSGFGCAHTPLSDTALQDLFPDTPILESAGDFAPAGTWEIAYEPSEMVCPGMTIPVPAENQTLIFTPAEDLAFGGILVEGVDVLDAMYLDQLGPGIFTMDLTLDQEGGSVSLSYFVVMSTDFTLDGTIVGTVYSPAGDCQITRPFFGAAAS